MAWYTYRMQDFSKEQLVLLGVFISFVTSLTTGIVVVSLLAQPEPPRVVESIQRVIEKTVIQPAQKEIITETEVVVKEVYIQESTGLESIVARSSNDIIFLEWYIPDSLDGIPQHIDFGIYLKELGGVLAVDSETLNNPEYGMLVYSGGELYDVENIATSTLGGLYHIPFEGPINESKDSRYSMDMELELGQSLIATYRRTNQRGDMGFARGYVTQLLDDEGSLYVVTDIVIPEDIMALVMDVTGKYVGIIRPGKSDVTLFSDLMNDIKLDPYSPQNTDEQALDETAL